jgi:hypothetical protein
MPGELFTTECIATFELKTSKSQDELEADVVMRDVLIPVMTQESITAARPTESRKPPTP